MLSFYNRRQLPTCVYRSPRLIRSPIDVFVPNSGARYLDGFDFTPFESDLVMNTRNISNDFFPNHFNLMFGGDLLRLPAEDALVSKSQAMMTRPASSSLQKTTQEYQLTVDIQDFDVNDIKVTIEDNKYLKISGSMSDNTTSNDGKLSTTRRFSTCYLLPKDCLILSHDDGTKDIKVDIEDKKLTCVLKRKQKENTLPSRVEIPLQLTSSSSSKNNNNSDDDSKKKEALEQTKVQEKENEQHFISNSDNMDDHAVMVTDDEEYEGIANEDINNDFVDVAREYSNSDTLSTESSFILEEIINDEDMN